MDRQRKRSRSCRANENERCRERSRESKRENEREGGERARARVHVRAKERVEAHAPQRSRVLHSSLVMQNGDTACHTYGRGMSHMCIRHVTHSSESHDMHSSLREASLEEILPSESWFGGFVDLWVGA